MNDIVYEEQKQLIKMWKQKYYDEKQELDKYKNIIDELEKYLYSININATYQEMEEVYRKMLRRIKELKGE